LGARLARAYEGAERRVLSAATLVLAQNGADRRAVQQVCGDGRAVVLPPGLDTAYFAPRHGTLDPGNIVFFAPLESPAQRDALQHLHRDLLPRVRMRAGDVRLTVVAPRMVPELEAMLRSDGNLRFASPLEDHREELWRAAVAAVPLRFGSGSRGHVAQLLAMGVPVVATPTAARHLDVVSGDGVLVATDGPDFSNALCQVLLDPSLRDDLSRKGRETATSRLSMAATYGRVSDLLATGPTAASR
jgi:glycosyltransferase involved in cell wall biosynthesis